MSSNKRRAGLKAYLEDALGVLRAAFFAGDGKLRALWRVALAVLAYLVWTNGVSILLTDAFGALFNAWGVTTLNLQFAPGYARWLSSHYANIISVVSSAGVAAFAFLAAPARKELRFRPIRLLTGAAIGLAVVGIAAAIMLALDSVRTTAASPYRTWAPLSLLPTLLAAALAEELFARGYILRMIKTRSSRALAYAASTLIFFYVTGAYALSAMGMVNMLLWSVVLCAVSERWTSWATAGLRFGWSYAVTCVFGFPGTSGTPVFRIYSVSEQWFTGGGNGLIAGVYMTIPLIDQHGA